MNENLTLDEATMVSLLDAYTYAISAIRPDGHWCGEVRTNVTATAEYIFLHHVLGLADTLEQDTLGQFLLSQQKDDGSWGLAPLYPGDVSTSTEAYLALKLFGLDVDNSDAMRRAQSYIICNGGVEKAKIFTRIYLAIFGLFPWSAVPQIPPELIFMPTWASINIYTLSSWARSLIIPLMIVCHHCPVFALPNGTSANNTFLDELWLRPDEKNVPYHRGIWHMLQNSDWVGIGFTIADHALSFLGGLRRYNPFRRLALNRCIEWVLAHQEASGDMAGYAQALLNGALAYALEGYKPHDAPIRGALEALERFAWRHEYGKHIQTTVSPVWDTTLMLSALTDIRPVLKDKGHLARVELILQRAVLWLRARQLQEKEGDWRVYRPQLTAGGFSFEYFNAWFPDLDDTAAAIIAFLKHDRSAVNSSHVMDAVKWTLGMQSQDGGWAAFDVNNDKLFLNKIPFSDMNSICDPSTADLTGHVLEALGLFLKIAREDEGATIPSSLLEKISKTCQHAVLFLSQKQEINGSWWARWGVNYIYGTSIVLAGLACFSSDENIEGFEHDNGSRRSQSQLVMSMVRPGIHFLLSIQNLDGGWGETLASYDYPEVTSDNENEMKKVFSEYSTPSQTAWALMGLLFFLPSTHKAIEAGVRYLVKRQTSTDLSSATKSYEVESIERDASAASMDSSASEHAKNFSDKMGRTWPNDAYTGTGHPGHFYMGYMLYDHYFPMMALGRFLEARKLERPFHRDIVSSEVVFPQSIRYRGLTPKSFGCGSQAKKR